MSQEATHRFCALATHLRSGMPLTYEYRIFWLDGEPLLTAPYWNEGDYVGGEPPPATFHPAAAEITSRVCVAKEGDR